MEEKSAPREPVRVQNNTARLIILQPTENYRKGFTLSPGGNEVPAAYWQELNELYVPPLDLEHGRKSRERFPGRETIEQLQRRVRIITPDSDTMGAQITVFKSGQEGFEKGMPSPPTLDNYTSEKAAIALVGKTDDAEALQRWTKDKRKPVAAAAAERLGVVKAGRG